MSLASLSPEEQTEVENWTSEIKERKKKILELLEALKTDLTNTESLEKGLTKLVLVLKELSKGLLDEKEVGLLLEFLIGKLEASALRNGCVVIGVHHLILHSANLPQNCEVPIFQSIYGESTVQCFSVSDRVLLFEILEFFLDERLSGLQNLGTVFVYSFMRAVNGERDPRCLVQIFHLFLKVVKNFELGIYCEDFFELMAAYFPLQYIPTEDQVPKETLAALLESCLLSHNSFSFFCFSLIADRLSDSSEDANESLDVLGFLAKAAKIFNPEPMRGFIDDYLTIFRRVALDPSDKTSGKEIHENIKNAITCVIQAFQKDEDMIKQIANTMTENCEPFVLQAEMGLTGRALSLLSVVASAHKVAADTVLPQTMFWIGNLINADTVNAPQNRREIVLEAIHYVPEWLTLTVDCRCEKLGNDSLPGFIEGLRQAEEKYGFEAYDAEYQLASVILKKKEAFSPFTDDIKKLMEKLVWRAPTDLKLPSKTLKSSIHSFVITISKTEFEKLAELLEKETRSMDESLIELYSLTINDEKSLEKFKIFVLEYLKNFPITKELSEIILGIFERNKDINNVNGNLATDVVDIILTKKFTEFDEKLILAEILQQIFTKLSKSDIEVHCQRILKFLSNCSSNLGSITYLGLIQSCDLELLNNVYSIFVKSNPDLLKYIHFSRILRGWKGSIQEKIPENGNYSLLLVENKAKFLLRDPDAVSGMESILESFTKESNENCKNWSIVDIFDFEHPGFNPEKNNFTVSVLWRQRILCQSLPIYVKYFSLIPKNEDVKKSIYLEALSPILANANKVNISLTTELLQIFPIIAEGLESLTENRNDTLLELILSGLVQLLGQTELEQISKIELMRTLSNIQKIMDNRGISMNSIIKCLDVLELVGKKGKMETLLPVFSSTIKCLVKITGSKKRIIRQKAAAVRNLWELTIG